MNELDYPLNNFDVTVYLARNGYEEVQGKRGVFISTSASREINLTMPNNKCRSGYKKMSIFNTSARNRRGNKHIITLFIPRSEDEMNNLKNKWGL